MDLKNSVETLNVPPSCENKGVEDEWVKKATSAAAGVNITGMMAQGPFGCSLQGPVGCRCQSARFLLRPLRVNINSRGQLCTNSSLAMKILNDRVNDRMLGVTLVLMIGFVCT